MSGHWAFRPERAPECVNGRFVCATYGCDKLVRKQNKYCLVCARRIGEQSDLESTTVVTNTTRRKTRYTKDS